jgi:Fe-S-cluster containining protein
MRTSDLYTIRRGELVRDNLCEEMRITEEELIKVREKEGGRGCIHYEEHNKACKIYDHRPAQCKVLKCWDTGEFLKLYLRPKAKREHIVSDRIILDLIERHEERCSYESLDGHVKEIEGKGEAAVQEILDMLKFDYMFRPFVSAKMGVSSNDMDFLFGRPLSKTIAMFGFQVTREPDGSFLLTVIPQYFGLAQCRPSGATK